MKQVPGMSFEKYRMTEENPNRKTCMGSLKSKYLSKFAFHEHLHANSMSKIQLVIIQDAFLELH